MLIVHRVFEKSTLYATCICEEHNQYR